MRPLLAVWCLAALIMAPGCGPADAAPPFVSGGSAASAAQVLGCEDDCSLADCQAETGWAGAVCYPTDSPYTLIWYGPSSSWRYRYPGIGFDVTPPPSAGWTAANSGSVVASGGTRTLTVPAEAASGGYRGEYRNRPSDPTTTPYCVDAVYRLPWTGAAAGNGGMGTIFTDATGLALATSGGGNVFTEVRYTNFTTYAAESSTVAGYAGALWGTSIGEDATERHFYTLDLDTQTKTEFGTGFDRTATITANKVGWASLGADADMARRVVLVHWREYACTP